jgi:hypothetical protein
MRHKVFSLKPGPELGRESRTCVAIALPAPHRVGARNSPYSTSGAQHPNAGIKPKQAQSRSIKPKQGERRRAQITMQIPIPVNPVNFLEIRENPGESGLIRPNPTQSDFLFLSSIPVPCLSPLQFLFFGKIREN